MPVDTSAITRRQLLRGFGAIGGAGAVYMALSTLGLLGGGPALAQGMSTTERLPAGSLSGKRAIVVGAGVAGLCAAMRLARAGADVIILEATNRTGGRSLTLRDGDSYRERDWNSPTTMRFEQVGDMPPDHPDNYLNAGPGRIPYHHGRLIDYCRELGVALQPYIFHSDANLMQNDKWNDGKPVRIGRLKNDLRGYVAEMLAKVQNAGTLDAPIAPAETEALLGMLEQFGQLTEEGARLVYKGAKTAGFVRAGYRVDPGDKRTPGQPYKTLSLSEIMQSDLWKDHMFDDLSYEWQSSLMQPTDGMDMVYRGFERAPVPGGRSVRDLVTFDAPVSRIDADADGVRVVAGGRTYEADYVVPTLITPLLAKLPGNFLPERARKVIAALDIFPACKVGLQGRSRFWENETRIYGGISWSRDITEQIWYPSYSFNTPTGVLTAAYNRGEDATKFQELSPNERLEMALAMGEKLHPGYRDKVFVENGVTIAWAKMPYQSGGWANDNFINQPKLFDELKAAYPEQRRVFLAGDTFSYWQGWQVGALDSAHLATDLIHQHATQAR